MKAAIDIYRGFEVFCDGIGDLVDPETYTNTYQMGVTNIKYDEKENILHVHLRRPGLLIGRKGETINKLQEYLKCTIHIHEVKRLWSTDN